MGKIPVKLGPVLFLCVGIFLCFYGIVIIFTLNLLEIFMGGVLFLTGIILNCFGTRGLLQIRRSEALKHRYSFYEDLSEYLLSVVFIYGGIILIYIGILMSFFLVRLVSLLGGIIVLILGSWWLYSVIQDKKITESEPR
ncbi:MAG: hypothetical protein ACFFCS_01845 [Candidatus Hodarchaeota archaeon]